MKHSFLLLFDKKTNGYSYKNGQPAGETDAKDAVLP